MDYEAKGERLEVRIMKRIKDLIVYQKAKQLVIDVYKLLEQFPDSERFALCGQLRRAVVSIPSNIAELNDTSKSAVLAAKVKLPFNTRFEI